MKKIILICALASTVAFSSCVFKQREVMPRLVSVTGSGQVQVPNNQATIIFSVETRSQDVLAASEENALKMAGVQQVLQENGVDSNNVVTSRYSIYEEMVPTGRLAGTLQYVVTNQISATIKELTRTGEIVDAVIKAGANGISSISYTPNPSAVEEATKEARMKAIKNAEEIAFTLASASGATVGSVITISDAQDSLPYARYSAMPAMALASTKNVSAQTQISGQDTIVTVSVNATYELK